MNKNFFNKEFDEGTNVKLLLFKKYIESWLPVFVMQHYKEIEIIDLFAGPGKDTGGNSGSPLIIIEEISRYCDKFRAYNGKVNLILNDIDQERINILGQNINSKYQECSNSNNCNTENYTNSCVIKNHLFNKEFSVIFNELYTKFTNSIKIPRFVFLDQFGIKYITDDIFKKLMSIEKLDFMFFISSAYLKRFVKQPEIVKYFNPTEFKFSDKRPAECHRAVFEYYKNNLKGNGYIGQFSIKKGSNYYGLIFYSHSPLGLSKFLDAAWAIDPHTGEANHNIDNDSRREGVLLIDFDGDGKVNEITKLSDFKKRLLCYLKEPRTNEEIFIFAIENGISTGKTLETLRELELTDQILVSENRRKGSFYIKFKPERLITIQKK